MAEFNIGRLLTAPSGVVLKLKGDLVTLLKTSNTGLLKRRDMYEHIIAPIFRLNKAKAFRMIEKLYRTIDAHGEALSNLSSIRQYMRCASQLNTRIIRKAVDLSPRRTLLTGIPWLTHRQGVHRPFLYELCCLEAQV